MPKRKLTRRNIDSKISDVKKPRAARLHEYNWQPEKHLEIERKPRKWRKTLAVASAIVGVAIICYSGYILVLKNKNDASAGIVVQNLKHILYGESGDLSAGRDDLKAVADDSTSARGASPLNLIPFLKGIPKGISDVSNLANAILQVDNSLTTLRLNGLQYFFSGRGSELVLNLKGASAGLKNITSLSSSIGNIAGSLGTSSGSSGNYLALWTDVRRETDSLDALVSLLSRPESHILMLFEDNSPLRPGGGRIAAYGDLKITNGSFEGVKVNDISVAENLSSAKIIPPLQLRAAGTAWKIRDLNWFFDFPSSALKAESLLGGSARYDGVIAVTPGVVSDFLSALKSIEIKNSKTPLSRENLASQIKKSGYPKLLDLLLPAVASRLQNLSGDEKLSLSSAAGEWVREKDVSIYFNDQTLEGYVVNRGWGSALFPLPTDFAGDYLGLSRAEIGTKTEVSETVGLRSQIESDGTIHNDLSITQTNKSSGVSQNFMQVFVPETSHLTQIAGNTYKKITPPINYSRAGYTADPDIKAIEDTRQGIGLDGIDRYKEAGRSMFGFWLSTSPHSASAVSLSYDSGRIGIYGGASYKFVFERQSGEQSALSYSIQAPDGWRWRGVNGQTFYYNSDRLPGRTVIDLTLEKAGSQ